MQQAGFGPRCKYIPVHPYRFRMRNCVGGPQSPHRWCPHFRFFAPKTEHETGKEECGEARRHAVSNLLYGLASTPSNGRVLESSRRWHPRRSWRQGQTLWRLHLGRRHAITDPYSRITVGGNRLAGPQYPHGGIRILVTFHTQRGSEPPTTGEERHGAELSPHCSRTSA